MERVIIIILFSIPFFWFKPGEMDLGGDSSRLYFYDPLNYLLSHTLWGISSSGVGAENISYYALPFISLLVVLKSFFHSPTILVALFHGIKLSVAFFSVFLIVRELIRGRNNSSRKNFAEYAGLLSGLFYSLSPAIIQGWDKAILTHDQLFLNPLMFLLLLLFLMRGKFLFLGLLLLVSFVFSHNFSYNAAPPFFAFYPLSFLFLLLYTKFVRQTKIPIKKLMFTGVLFVALQAFHLLPQIISLTTSGSASYSAVFSEEAKFSRGLSYFTAIASSIKVSLNLQALPQMMDLWFGAGLFVVVPAIVILGFLWNQEASLKMQKEKKTMTLLGIFFLISLFFASANITDLGFQLYKSLFYLPGFAMFRNFYGQWGYVFFFFYTLLFGYSLFVVFTRVPNIFSKLIPIGFVLLVVVSAFPFIRGDLINKVIWQSKDVRIFMEMDPAYEKVLSFIRSLPSDAKVLTLPLTDPGYQIVAGKSGGAYQGPSTISYLSGKQDFAGFDELGKFNQFFLETVKKREFAKLQEILGILNIRYIFYNADPRIYDTLFPAFPYSHVRKFLPKDQNSYKIFLGRLPLKQLKNISNKYYIYELEQKEFRPKFYTTSNAFYFNKQVFDWSVPLSFEEGKTTNTAFFDLQNPSKALPAIRRNFQEITPQSSFLKMLKNPDPPLFIHHSFARISPSSLTYPLVMIREYLTTKKDTNSHNLIDRRLFFSAKRLLELEQWGNDLKITFAFGDAHDLLQWYKSKALNPWSFEALRFRDSWEMVLARYVKNFEESIEEVERAEESSDWKIERRFLISEYLLRHRKRFFSLISGLGKYEDEKNYISKLLDSSFKYLFDRLKIPFLNPTTIAYDLPSFGEEEKKVKIYVEKRLLSKIQEEEASLKVGDEILSPVLTQLETQWVEFNAVLKYRNVLELKRRQVKNLIEDAQFISLENPSKEQVKFHVPAVVRFRNGLVWKVTDWQPKSYYLLSFEYRSSTPFSIRLFEQEEEGEDRTTALILENQLKSKPWERYQAVVRSGNADTLFLHLGGDKTDSPLPKIELKDLSLVHIPHPKIFLVEENEAIEQQDSLPKISFSKINPTRYRVKILGANDPFYLIFNQAFNRRWKLFLDSKEQNYKLSFFDPVSDDYHFQANGYTNAWYIAPADVGKRQDYTLIVEMTTQWFFYVGLIVSLLTLAGICIFTATALYNFIKSKMRGYEK